MYFNFLALQPEWGIGGRALGLRRGRPKVKKNWKSEKNWKGSSRHKAGPWPGPGLGGQALGLRPGRPKVKKIGKAPPDIRPGLGLAAGAEN